MNAVSSAVMISLVYAHVKTHQIVRLNIDNIYVFLYVYFSRRGLNVEVRLSIMARGIDPIFLSFICKNSFKNEN